MICDRCRTELPDDAVACYRCGRVTEATFVSPITPAASTISGPAKIGLGVGAVVAIVALAVVAAAAVGGLIAVLYFREQPGPQRAERVEAPRAGNTQRVTQPTGVPPTPDRQSVKLVNEVRTVAAGDIWSIAFTMPSSGTVKGGFRTTAGGSKDIDAMIVDDTNYALLNSGQRFRSIVGRIKAERGRLDANLTAGNYFVIFSNKHSWLTPKEIATEIDIEY